MKKTARKKTIARTTRSKPSAQAAKKPAAKAAARNATATKPAAKAAAPGANATKRAAPRPDAQPAGGRYTPSEIHGTGWKPFRYPPE